MAENDRTEHVIRLGYHDRANLMPLLYPLKAGWVGLDAPWRLDVVNGTPSEVLRGLVDGGLDAAFVPPLALAERGGQLSTLGGWGLASEAAAHTALLVAPRRLDMMDGERVAISPEAEGSTAEHLLRILAKPYYYISLELRHAGEEEYDAQNARLLYADGVAQRAQRLPEGWVAEDLGVAWFVLTGLPAVWEILAASRELQSLKPGAVEALQSALKGAQRAAQEQQSSITEEAGRRLGYTRERVKELFARQRYTLGEREQKALAQFFTLASRAGLTSP